MYLNVKPKWSTIKAHVVAGIEALFPITSGDMTLALTSVEMKDIDATIPEQRKALVAGESLTMPVYGNFTLTKDGRHLDSAKVKLLDLPVITHRGTFVVQGKDYNVFNQMRLKPGVYTLQSEDTGAVTTRFNLGKGLSFKLVFNNDASVIYLRFDTSEARAGGQTKIPIYSVLKALGASDEAMLKAWGQKLYETNRAEANVNEDLKTLVNIAVYKTRQTSSPIADVRNYFEGTALNEETTQVTLGAPFQKVTADALLRASERMLKVYRKDDEGDDLDSLLFKEILAAEDHLMLRIDKGARGPNGVLAKMKRKLSRATTVREVVQSGILTRLIETFFTTSSLASPQTEINPVEILETNHKITAMGEGGIKTEHGIPMSARNLHPSHFGYLDPIRTTESLRVGVDLRMTQGATIKDRNIYNKFLDKNGKSVELKPTDLNGKHVGFAGQEHLQEVRAMYNGEMVEVPRSKVDYWMAQPEDMFTHTSAMVPFLANNSGNRITMASRMITQALPLVHREAPLVQVAKGNTGKSVEHDIGSNHFSALAPEDGTVTAIGHDYITVNTTKVHLYKDFPLNVKTPLSMTPIVAVNDKVKKGQVIAESNFVKDGALALGVNLRTAYVPYQGWTHEDGIVISESAAEKLTSEHMYMEELDKTRDIVIDKQRYSALFPTKITPEQLKKLDETGVVKKGTVVSKDDYLIVAMAKKEPTNADAVLAKMHSMLKTPYRDVSVKWEHDTPGTVTDVISTNKLIKVVIKANDRTIIGDKLTGLYGNKGTVSKIVPDNEMPRTADGKPLEMVLNPAGVVSRINPGQLYSSMAGKLAEHTGKTYVTKNFENSDMSKKVLGELKAKGIAPEEDVIDPVTKKPIGKVFVGNNYTMKLMKQTAGNFGARSTKAYDVNLQPSKGGEEGAKAIGLMDFYALLGHNARAVAHEAGAYKSQKNEEFWDAIKLGLPIPPAKEPLAYDKFKALVTSTGINVHQEGNHVQITPLTDKHTLSRSSGAVKNGLMLKGDIDKLVPERGGLFDRELTGGMAGQNWTHVDLAEPIVNPIFKGVVKTLVPEADKLSGAEVREALKKIKLDERIAEVKQQMGTARGTSYDKLVKELRYLSALKKNGMKPEDYVITKFPVLPPLYRPIYPAQDGSSPMVSDMNLLYRDMINVNNELHAMKDFPHEEKAPLRKALENSAAAIAGIMDPINVKSQKQQLKGALTILTKPTAKEGFFHRKLLYRPQDATGRGTILPDPYLHIDEAKIPEEMLHQLYKPFLIRNLVRKGMAPLDAAKEVQDKTINAKVALKEEIKERPVILNRAPTLHKYNVMAFKPIPVEGKSIFIPPLVIKGFNADFDGDSIHGDSWVIVERDDGSLDLTQIKDV